jgi:hypothetical protein
VDRRRQRGEHAGRDLETRRIETRWQRLSRQASRQLRLQAAGEDGAEQRHAERTPDRAKERHARRRGAQIAILV